MTVLSGHTHVNAIVLYRKASKSGRYEDWSSFKRLRNKVNNLKKHAKESFYNTIENILIESHISNPKL